MSFALAFATEIGIELTVYFEGVSGPGVTHGVEEICAASARNGD